MPTDEPRFAGFTKTGYLSAALDLRDGLARRLFPLGAQQRDVLHDGQPGLREEPLHHVLVHAGRGAQHARADVGDAGQLEEPLDGAVFAEGAVQHGKHHVERLAAERCFWSSAAEAGLRRQQRGNALVQQLCAGRGFGIAGAQPPRDCAAVAFQQARAHRRRPASGLPW